MTKKVNNCILGDTYIDTLHKREGIATCYATHLTGCNRICLEWIDNDGDIKELWVDETRLKHKKTGDMLIEPEDIEPGPGPDPKKRGIK